MAVATLFDESAALVHAETWLKERKLASLKANNADKHFFDATLKMLVELLPGVEAIYVNADSVEIEGSRIGRIPLGALSDGYLTTMGWVIDMIARWAHDARGRGVHLDDAFADQMTGVALVDEIDLHLHPCWQRDVIRDMRKFFPKMSFIVTTHNPLTLLGAKSGEIQVLSYDGDAGRIVAKQADLPLGAGAEQVLTGEWFDLPSTLDDSTLDLLAEHRRVLRRGSVDSVKAKKIEEQLNDRLGSYSSTSLERLAQSAAAEILRDNAVNLTAKERIQARAKIVEKLSPVRRPSRRKRST
jgi:predicted ATP-binding protein involved in virulence